MAISLAGLLMLGPDPSIARAYREAGHADVARAYSAASDDFRLGISEAIESADPDRLNPWWELELWRICWRESKCGRFGPVGIHEGDRWVGANSYAWAVVREQLGPIRCPEHRLVDYGPVIEAWEAWEHDHSERPLIRAHFSELPHGTRVAEDFGTRGGWGMNAARALRRVGECVAPEQLDDPRVAALAAVREFAACEQPETRIECTCVDHTALWVGRRRFASRPLVALDAKSRASAVQSQCGRSYAISYVVSELLSLQW